MVDKIKQAHSNGVGIGMAIAAAIVASHSEVHAEEILQTAGLTSIAKMRQIGVDDYDIDQLRDVVSEIQRKEKLRASKATGAPQ